MELQESIYCMIELFDTHFHPAVGIVAEEYLRQLPAEKYKIFMMAVGAGLEESLAAARFAENCDSAWFACGVHPHGAEEFNGDYNDFSSRFAGHGKLKAVGELGLDYFYDFTPRDLQKNVFKGFLQLALTWNLPAVVHIRDKEDTWNAYMEAWEILRDFAGAGGRFVVHCFAGSAMWAERFLELGAYIGVTGMVTFKKADNIRDVVKMIPHDRLLIETDSPYLAPVPFRGKENHPGLLPHVAEFTANFLNTDIAEFAALTTANAGRFFRI